MIFTPQEIIQDSLTHFKEEQAKARREEVRKSLDYYSGSLTHQYIEDYFNYGIDHTGNDECADDRVERYWDDVDGKEK